MDKFVLKEYQNRFWQVAEVFKNGEKIASINKFYTVTPEWILIYDAVGGTGTGYKRGEVVQKIFIGNSEYLKEIAHK